MHIVTEYTIELQCYHGKIAARLIFNRAPGQSEESSLYSLSELQNIIALWRDNALQGSFAIGTQLAQNPVCYFIQKGN